MIPTYLPTLTLLRHSLTQHPPSLSSTTHCSYQRTLTKGEVTQYIWPPVHFVWNQLLSSCWISTSLTCLVGYKPGKQEASYAVIVPPKVNTNVRGSNTAWLVWLNTNQANCMPAVQWYFPHMVWALCSTNGKVLVERSTYFAIDGSDPNECQIN